jgi:hypothetical protein
MKLREFFDKYKLPKTKFAAELDMHFTVLWRYITGTRRPRQARAEQIEKKTDGLVTVFELRGTDDRQKRREKEEQVPGEGSSSLVRAQDEASAIRGDTQG